jgi:hypothetical protein
MGEDTRIGLFIYDAVGQKLPLETFVREKCELVPELSGAGGGVPRTVGLPGVASAPSWGHPRLL